MAAVAMHPAFRLQQQQHVLMMGMSLRQKMALSSPPMSDSSQTSDRPTLELTDDVPPDGRCANVRISKKEPPLLFYQLTSHPLPTISPQPELRTVRMYIN
ncbi:hypothetical protein Bbelb_059160 [Branchiostoma belcheri]|nr:hypothetical protein Bbelb_059160 [Branchiostoma belcheri]